jgi:mRNA interferase MazF
MKKAGQVAVVQFPTITLNEGKPRPVLLIASLPGPHEDWLVSMFSTQLQQAVEGFDEILDETQSDFQASGLKIASVIRIARLAVVPANMLVGSIGEISLERLQRIQQKLARWIASP